jgi:UDP-galactopyranose mutase
VTSSPALASRSSVAAARPVLVVGAGLAGAVHARVLAEHGRRVHVIDRRSHVAGNAYDEVDATGVRRHAYGPHLFHTNSPRVFAWLSRFSDFVPYEHRVTVRLPDGRGYVPLPVNRETVARVFDVDLPDAAATRDLLERVSVPCPRPRNAAEWLHARIGRRLADLLYRPYTRKMWGLDLEDLDASVVRRVPVRHDDESRYFPDDRFQCLPRDGYEALVRRMLDHPSIRVETGVAFERSMLASFAFCFNSMSVDEYFGGVLGPLPYRSIRFHHGEVAASEPLGPTAQVNFADASPYTRRSDWARLPGHRVRETDRRTVTLEEPCDARDNGGERYYPVPDGDGSNAALYARYRALAARERRVRFVGRCGTYRYLDMDQVVAQSLESATAWASGRTLAPEAAPA